MTSIYYTSSSCESSSRAIWNPTKDFFESLHLVIWYPLTAAQLAQFDKRRSAELEAAGSSPGRTNTQGL